MLTLLARFKGYLFILGLMAAILGYAWYEHTRFLNIKIEFQDFIENSLALQLKKEKEHAERLNVVLSERDASLVSLRNSQNRTRELQSALASQGRDRVCFKGPAFDTTLSGISGLITEGETALINLQACLAAWPK